MEEAWSLGQKLVFSFASPEVILAGALRVKKTRIRFGNGEGYEEVVIKYISARAWGINTNEFQSKNGRIWHKDILRGKKYAHRVGFAELERECEKSNEKLLISWSSLRGAQILLFYVDWGPTMYRVWYLLENVLYENVVEGKVNFAMACAGNR